MAEVAEGLLDPAAVEHVQAAHLQVQIAPRFVDAFEHVRGHIRADVELPAQLADVGNPVGAGEAHANLDLLSEAEGMGVVTQIVRGHALQQLP